MIQILKNKEEKGQKIPEFGVRGVPGEGGVPKTEGFEQGEKALVEARGKAFPLKKKPVREFRIK